MAFETIGEKLRQARLDKHISIDELQQITKVQKRYLEAIETDDFDSLPGKFYVRAFIRQYAQAVGEDGDLLVDVYDGKAIMPGSELPQRPRPEQVKGSRKALHQEEGNGHKFWTSLPTILLALVALAIISVVAYTTWQDRKSSPIITSESSSIQVEGSISSVSSSAKESSTAPSSSTTTTTTSSKEETMAVTAGTDSGDSIEVSVANADNPVTLEFTATQNCWVGVQVDGSYVYQYTLAAGETQSTQLADNASAATITLGSSGNATVKANGTELPVNATANSTTPKSVQLSLAYKAN
ncbi:MAG: RodZ domain-containing protein [Enterococcus sp.]